VVRDVRDNMGQAASGAEGHRRPSGEYADNLFSDQQRTPRSAAATATRHESIADQRRKRKSVSKREFSEDQHEVKRPKTRRTVSEEQHKSDLALDQRKSVLYQRSQSWEPNQVQQQRQQQQQQNFSLISNSISSAFGRLWRWISGRESQKEPKEEEEKVLEAKEEEMAGNSMLEPKVLKERFSPSTSQEEAKNEDLNHPYLVDVNKI